MHEYRHRTRAIPSGKHTGLNGRLSNPFRPNSQVTRLTKVHHVLDPKKVRRLTTGRGGSATSRPVAGLKLPARLQCPRGMIWKARCLPDLLNLYSSHVSKASSAISDFEKKAASGYPKRHRPGAKPRGWLTLAFWVFTFHSTNSPVASTSSAPVASLMASTWAGDWGELLRRAMPVSSL